MNFVVKVTVAHLYEISPLLTSQFCKKAARNKSIRHNENRFASYWYGMHALSNPTNFW